MVRENYLRQIDTEIGWSVLGLLQGPHALHRQELPRRGAAAGAHGAGVEGGLRAAHALRRTGACARTPIRADTFSDEAQLLHVGVAAAADAVRRSRLRRRFSVYSERRGEYQAFLRTTLVGGEASFTRDVARDLPLRLAYSLEFGRTEAPPALLCALFSFCDSQSRAFITDQQPSARGGERARGADPHGQPVRAPGRARCCGSTCGRRCASSYSDPQLEFLKGLSDASYYKAISPAVTFAARLRLGTVLGRTLSFNDSTGFVPPEERLYAGGATSVRGFQQNALGDLIYIAEQRAGDRCRATATRVYIALAGTATPTVPAHRAGGRQLADRGQPRAAAFAAGSSPSCSSTPSSPTRATSGSGRRRSGADRIGGSTLCLNGLKWTPGVGRARVHSGGALSGQRGVQSVRPAGGRDLLRRIGRPRRSRLISPRSTA